MSKGQRTKEKKKKGKIPFFFGLNCDLLTRRDYSSSRFGLRQNRAGDEKIMLTQSLTRINVPLARDEAQIIVDLARQEFRHPREQARLLIYEALRARGLLPELSPAPTAREGVKNEPK